jgi:hypothetical protein
MTLSAKPAPGVDVLAFGRRIAPALIDRTLSKADAAALAGLVAPVSVLPDRLAVLAALAAVSAA